MGQVEGASGNYTEAASGLQVNMWHHGEASTFR
jgi:hypothetical protein